MSPEPTNFFQLLTPPGPAAIAVLRICGPKTEGFIAAHLAREIPAPMQIVRVGVRTPDGAVVDDALLSNHGNHSATDVRLHLHGNPGIVQTVRAALTRAGFAESDPVQRGIWDDGAFVQDAVLRNLPRMRSKRGVTWLLNQPARWRAAFSKLAQADFATQQAVLAEIGDRRALIDWFAKSIRIAIVGPPNAGKSALINLLADQAVSLVSDRAGTTRDWVEAPGELDGFPVVWCDTAGIRASEDPLEAAGIAHGLRVAAGADMTVALCDITAGPAAAEQFLSALADAGTHPTLIVGNKADISGEPKRGPWGLALSAHRSEDRVAFENAVRKRLGRDQAQLSEAAAFTPALVAACEQAASSPERFRMLAESIVNDRDSRPDVLVDDSPPRI